MASESDSFEHQDDEGHVSRQSSPVSELSAITIQSQDSGTGGDKLNFQFRTFVQDKERKKEIWAVNFNHFVKPGQPNIFAAVGGPRFWIYEATVHGKINLLMCYEDPDPKEDFWTCCWTLNLSTHKPILLTAGDHGIIHIIDIDVTNQDQVKPKHLKGHGGAINQLKVASRRPYLLASASKDHSIRLWNIQTNVCIATFHGIDSHRDEVVSIDFNLECTKLVSGGIDHMIAIWDLNTPEIKTAIEQSTKYNEKTSVRAFKTLFNPFPIFTTRRMHKNYIDCVEWFGDFILSKSNENDLFCWQLGLLPCDKKQLKNGSLPINSCTKLIEFDVADCEYYFTRFTTNRKHDILAIGNRTGEVRLFDLEIYGFPFEKLKDHRREGHNVRDLSFSHDGHSLVFTSDDGRIWLYQN